MIKTEFEQLSKKQAFVDLGLHPDTQNPRVYFGKIELGQTYQLVNEGGELKVYAIKKIQQGQIKEV